MPHLTQQFSISGPIIDVLVGVSHPKRDALLAAGFPVPSPVPMRTLIDTGASSTCVDPYIIQALSLTPSGSISIHTPSTNGAALNCNQYDISLVLIHPKLSFTFGALPVIESNLISQGIQALLGRDVLKECLFIYDGASGLYTLTF